MFDWSLWRDLIWEARLDGLVLLGQALWTNVVTHWWFGPLLALIAISVTRKAWLGLLRFVGLAVVRGRSDG